MRRQGPVKRLFRDQEYGFISARNAEYFFHAYDVEGRRFEDIAEGDSVEFNRADTARGLAAISIRRALN
jgi:cold shock CspA family protein